MSWDIVLFNSRQKIEVIEELEENSLEPTDFCAAFESHFNKINASDNHRVIEGKDFSIEYFIDDEHLSNKVIHLYGENSLYEIVVLAKKNNWQIFDTGMGQMINLDNPAINGYVSFQKYLEQILHSK